MKQLQWEQSQAFSNVRHKKKTPPQEIGLYCMQVHQQEAWTKYLLPVQVLVTAFSFIFGMLERNLSKLVEVIKTHI